MDTSHDIHSTVVVNNPLGHFDTKNPRAIATQSNTVPSTVNVNKLLNSSSIKAQLNLTNSGRSPSPVADTMFSKKFQKLPPPVASPNVTPTNNPTSAKYEDIEIFDDFENDLNDDEEYRNVYDTAASTLTQAKIISKGYLISTQKAYNLRKLIFPGTGTEDSRARSSFQDEWKGKGFLFSTVSPEVAYGLVQLKV